MTDFVTEIKNDLHALWARLSAEGHALAASVEAMYEKALNAAETAEKTTVAEAMPVVAEAVETVETDAKTVATDAEAAAEGAVTEATGA